MSITSRLKETYIGEFWLKHEQKIILAIGIILIAGASFEAGFLQGKKNQQDSIVVNKTPIAEVAGASTSPVVAEKDNPGNVSVKTAPAPTDKASAADSQKCALVASKNSDKYHLATCQFAQKIKAENKICFTSAGEAEKKGFQGAKCCIK